MIIDCSACLGVTSQLTSDAPSQFKNEVPRIVSEGVCAPYQFTLTYLQWSNDADKHLKKTSLRFLSVVVETYLEHEI